MTIPVVKMVFCMVLGFVLVSCDGSRGSREASMYEERERELEELRAELKAVRKQVDEIKVDPSRVSVEEWRKKAGGQKAGLEALSTELEALQKSVREAREQLADFRKKYPN